MSRKGWLNRTMLGGAHLCQDMLFWGFTPQRCCNIPTHPSPP